MTLFLSQPGTQVQELERRGGGSPFKTTLLLYRVRFLSLQLGLLCQGFIPREDAFSQGHRVPREHASSWGHHVPLAGRLSHHLTPDASGKSGCSAGWSD